jgi:hypothetical protein
LGPDFPCSLADEDQCTRGAVCDATVDFCTNPNPGGGCGGLGKCTNMVLYTIQSPFSTHHMPDVLPQGINRVVVGAVLGGYIILYGQVQSWTPQLVTGPLNQTPPNKMTEVFWGVFNCYPTLIGTIVVYASESFIQYQLESMTAWLAVIIVSFAVIFAINSSIHSFLVVKYAAHDKVAVSVGFYYMSNALGRLLGTLGSGFLFTYAGGTVESLLGYNPGMDARIGLAACLLAGTLSSVLAAIITFWIKDEAAGLKCGNWTIISPTDEENEAGKEENQEPQLT